MRLLPRRRSGATLVLTPERPVLPTDAVTATLTLAEPLDDVAAARIEIGYVNTYTHEWAPGSTHGPGGYREVSDWVAAGDAPLTVAGGNLPAGTHSATVRVPSWAPPSSATAVRWVARLAVEGPRRVPEAEATFTVLSPAPDPAPTQSRFVQGENVLADTLRFEISTDAVAYRAGTEVRGTISVIPTQTAARTATADVRFHRPQISHPLERNPAPPIDWFSRPHVTVATDLVLVEGRRTDIPFAITVPVDAEPTLEAVHSSLEWWLVATITFAGLTGGIERARREIVVHTG